jgi:hypothetical protein
MTLDRSSTAALAAGSLVAGFAVAQLSGVRALGGLVLVAAVAVCALQWRRAAGSSAAAALVGLYAAAFVVSHLIAPVLGAWPSVLLVAAVVGGASLLATRRTDPLRDAPHAQSRAGGTTWSG